MNGARASLTFRVVKKHDRDFIAKMYEIGKAKDTIQVFVLAIKDIFIYLCYYTMYLLFIVHN